MARLPSSMPMKDPAPVPLDLQGGGAAARSGLSVDRWQKEAAKTGAASAPKRRIESKPDTSESALRRARMWNQGMRRELTTEEWGKLTAPQQNAVRFNADILAAYDQDEIDSPNERRNVKALISNIGLDERTQKEVLDKTSTGMGLTVQYGDVLGPKPTFSVKDTAEHADARTAPSIAVIAQPKNDRQRQTNQIAAKLDGFLARTAEARNAAAIPEADARAAEFQFASPGAKTDFEAAFTTLLDPAVLSSMPWSVALQDMERFGYSPDEFKDYVRSRIQHYPAAPGLPTLADFDAWFGS